MRRILLFSLFTLFASQVFGQADSTSRDSSNTIVPTENPTDSLKNNASEGLPSVTGVAVSPSHFHLSVPPGEEEEVKITITNSTDKENSFKISFVDFDMNEMGKPLFLPPDSSREYSLSRWATLAPTFVTLAPFEKKKISLRVSIPEGPEGRKAAWTVVMVEQQVPREELSVDGNTSESVAFGVVPLYAFGIYTYQNPPNVDNNKVEINNFQYIEADSLSEMHITAENIGDGIAYCTSYIDLTNISTGFQTRLLVKRFTIVPGIERVFKFRLPPDLPKGDYVAIGVVDFKNAEEIQAAKTSFKID
ncbi:MAG: DUF916 domain-containing protein [Crocinitomicaceae bacterium]|nr:DUF916 domain-containing protein [Crocinitomicaceae bacterium]